MAQRKVLIVEDDADIARLVALHLRDLRCDCEICGNGAAALARDGRYDLVVLDLMLPGLDGLSICTELRRQGRRLPILMLTAKSAETDRVVGLELGADDYLTKPFSVGELVARVKALFRRVEQFGRPVAAADSAPLPIEHGGLRIDAGRRAATRDGEPLPLTAKEFDLLLHFARHPGRVHTRMQLLEQVWGTSHEGYEHTVNTHINRLRGDGMFPLLGDDPRSHERSKPFSVTPVPSADNPEGYPYVVLRGEDVARVEEALQERHLLGLAGWSVAGSLALGLGLGLLGLRMVMRRLQAQQAKVELRAGLRDGLPRVDGDIALIERALENLIANALDHTAAGGRVGEGNRFVVCLPALAS